MRANATRWRVPDAAQRERMHNCFHDLCARVREVVRR
jgi:hypothetical protein